MQIRLTRKLADVIDGVDLSQRTVGDLIEMPQHDADLLIAEGWALSAPTSSTPDARRVRAEAAGARVRPATRAGRARVIEHLRHVGEQLGRGRFESEERRRAEDRIREQRHDRFAHTVHVN